MRTSLTDGLVLPSLPSSFSVVVLEASLSQLHPSSVMPVRKGTRFGGWSVFCLVLYTHSSKLKISED
jgi:hypothetical protein